MASIPMQSPAAHRWLGPAALVCAVFLAYLPALRATYIWDDDLYLTSNEWVKSASGLPGIWSVRPIPGTSHLAINTPQYYPLVFTSFWIEHRLWGLQPFGYHLVNVLLHAANALLVWRIAARLGLPAAWLIAALFALHPLQVESVAWITERKNVLSGLFFLLALDAYVSFEQRGRWSWYALCLGCFLAALLSKSVTATLPVVLLLVVLALRGRIPLRSALCILPLLAIGVLSGLWTAYLEQTTVGATGQDWEHSLPERLLIIAPRAYLTYFQKTIVPWPLVFIYPRWEVMAGAWLLYASLVLTIVLFVAAVVVARRGWPTPLLLLVFSAVTLAPALGVVNVYPHRFSFVADHFAYLGILGFLALLTILGVHYVGRLVPAERQRTLGGGLAALVLVVLGSLTYLHSLSFHDARRLWEHTVRMNPGAWIGWLNLGMMDASDGKLDSALAHFEKAAENPDGRASAFGSTGLVLTRAGRLDEAVTAYRLAVEADPRSAKAFAGLGGALSAAGRMDEAEAALQRGLELDPLNDALHVNLGILRYKQERYAEAEASLRRALELEPRGREGRRALAETLRKLGRTDEAAEIARAPAGASPASPTDAAERVRALYDRGRYADALQACQDALRDWPQDRRLLLELAWMRATCPDDAIRSAREAARIIMPLARGNKPEQQRDPRVLDTLACALAASGDFANAIRTAELAAQHARGQNRAELVAEIDARIGLFRNNTPYRHQPR